MQKKREDASNPLKIAKAHYNWAEKLPNKILDHIPEECYAPIPKKTIKQFIGGNSIIYGHATMPANAQKYKKPMWLLPSSDSIYDAQDRSTINGRRDEYLATRKVYTSFANEVLLRVEEISK